MKVKQQKGILKQRAKTLRGNVEKQQKLKENPTSKSFSGICDQQRHRNMLKAGEALKCRSRTDVLIVLGKGEHHLKMLVATAKQL